MRSLKAILLIVINCVLVNQCLSSKNVVSPVDEQVVAPPEAAVKINWVPVWNDNEGNNEFVSRISAEESKEENGQTCQAPNGVGLRNLLREVDKILPKQQITNIAKSYAEDLEIRALKSFMESPLTKEKVKAMHSSQEYQILKDYVCRVLHMDLNEYNKLARTIIQPLMTRAETQPRKGIRGLIDEINAVMPHQQLHDLYKNLLASDDELAEAVANLKSTEFHQLLLNVKNNVAEYQELRQQMITLGVPIEEMQQLLATTLGWSPELGLVF